MAGTGQPWWVTEVSKWTVTGEECNSCVHAENPLQQTHHELPEARQEPQKFWRLCRILLRPFVVGVKAKLTTRVGTRKERTMPQYLIAIQHPENYDASLEGEAMIRDIIALNKEMIAAGVRDFAGGLQPAGKAKSLRTRDDGEVMVTDGPYLEAKEHVGGIWLLKCADMEEALKWARKAVAACRVPVEVREFLEIPPKLQADPDRNQ
jgi:hypothetical protein